MPKFRFQDMSLGIDERVKALLEELTQDEKLQLITPRMQAIPRLGIKAFKMGTEAARGLVVRNDACDAEPYPEAPTTVFPEPFGLAATFDTSLLKEVGTITGIEARIYNKEGKSTLNLWAPTVDLERDPRWGRNEEGYGEDPHLTGRMTAALTKGMIGDDENYIRVIPTLKHFYANNHEEDRTCDSADIPEVLKHDYYQKAFEYPLKHGGAKSVMPAYSMVNGLENIWSPELTNFCKKECGMLFSVSDNWDFVECVTRHKTDRTHADTVARIYKNGGADIINDEQDVVENAVRTALDRGLITESDIDNALFGALKARFMLGEFDDKCPYAKTDKKLLCCDAYQKSALKAAEESIILLRNRRVGLPLRKDEKIAVVGLHGDMNFRDWYTGYSDKNPTILDAVVAKAGRENVSHELGNDIIALRNAETGFYFSVQPDGTLECDSPTINEACLLELFDWGGGYVSFKSKHNGKFLRDDSVMKCTSDEIYGWTVPEKFTLVNDGRECMLKNYQDRFLYITKNGEIAVTDKLKPKSSSQFNIELFSSGIDKVKKTVTEAHNVLLVLGNNPMIGARETVDRKSLDFSERQKKLIDLVLSLNENAVLLVVSGYPYEIDSRFHSVLHTSHGGPEMGTAVARVLFGEVSPAGRCPVTWYSSAEELGDIKDYNIIRTESTYRYYRGEPLFPFGHGLSYTAFRYSALRLNKTSFEAGEKCEVSFEVKNIGSKTSDEVVQLYVSAPRFSSAVPIKELKAFKRINVEGEKSATITLEFDISDLAMWDLNNNKFTLFNGKYEIQVGPSSAEIFRTAEIIIRGEEYIGLDVSKPVPAFASWEYVGVEFKTDKDLNEYALLTDAQSSISFENCNLAEQKNVEIIASNPSTKTTVYLVCAETDEIMAAVKVPTTGSFSEFKAFSASIKPRLGKYTIKIKTGGIVSIRSFRIY